MNISEIEKAAVEAMDPDDLSQYRTEVEPFVGPLRAAFLTGMIDKDVRRVSLVVTAE